MIAMPMIACTLAVYSGEDVMIHSVLAACVALKNGWLPGITGLRYFPHPIQPAECKGGVGEWLGG